MQATPNFTPNAANGKTHPSEQLNINLYGFTDHLFWRPTTAAYAITDPDSDVIIYPCGRALFTAAATIDWIESRGAGVKIMQYAVRSGR